MRVTDTVEDYLKALLALTSGGEAAGTVALADLLGISAAAATAMLKRLTAAGLADHAPYHGVRLTGEGTTRQCAWCGGTAFSKPFWSTSWATTPAPCTRRRSGWSTPLRMN